MTLTYADSMKIVSRTLGGESQESPGDLVNWAGNWLVDVHGWGWREQPPETVAVTGGQAFVNLPLNTAQITAYDATEGLVNSLELTDMQTIIRLRTDTEIASNWNIWAAVAWNVDANGIPQPRLELYPTPEATDTAAFTVQIRLGWSILADDTDIVQLPFWMESIYNRSVRAYARGYEEEDAMSLEEQQMRLVTGPEFRAAVRRDALTQADEGPIAGGAVAQGRVLRDWNGPVAPPSFT